MSFPRCIAAKVRITVLAVCVYVSIGGAIAWGETASNGTVEIQLPEAAPSSVGNAATVAGSTGTAAAIEASTNGAQDADENALRFMTEGIAMETNGNLVGARDKYYAALALVTGGAGRTQVEARLGQVNMNLLLTPSAIPEKAEYTVKPGDSLNRIARMFGTTEELICTNNWIRNPSLIRAGDRLRVFNGKFALLVSKSRNDLLVTMNERFFKRYRVGTGKFGKTPAGTFVIKDRIKEPPWWREGKMIPYGDKENILGTHWLSLKSTGATDDLQGYGLHGTWDDESIGKQASFGCVRLHNRDVEELYIVLPGGTPVSIVE